MPQHLTRPAALRDATSTRHDQRAARRVPLEAAFFRLVSQPFFADAERSAADLLLAAACPCFDSAFGDAALPLSR
jgi:hypothetical protein